MTKKEDQRVTATKQRLQEAFLRLLKTTPIHAISILELCGEAGVNRTTFYNHYGSQYDLLENISRRFLRAIETRLESAEADSRESVQERVVTVLAFLEENRELSVQLLNNNIDPAFAERIFALPKIGDLLDAALSGCGSERQRAATISFAVHGSYRLLQEWINREERAEPREQAELMLGLARRVCR
ncbi:MAG: TetR/AcrR family transcriptional regulator [Eubacteriales bacterium]|nr:TetR/AcrR family transcriptional regulator [Eubacteriales bacterium]